MIGVFTPKASYFIFSWEKLDILHFMSHSIETIKNPFLFPEFSVLPLHPDFLYSSTSSHTGAVSGG